MRNPVAAMPEPSVDRCSIPPERPSWAATVEIENPVSHYNQSAKTDSQGNFEFDNVPFNNYHLSASAKGFQDGGQDVNVRSPCRWK